MIISRPILVAANGIISLLFHGSVIFHWDSLVAQSLKNLPANAGHVGSVLGLGRCPGEGNSNPLQYSCLGNPMVSVTRNHAGYSPYHCKESNMMERQQPTKDHPGSHSELHEMCLKITEDCCQTSPDEDSTQRNLPLWGLASRLNSDAFSCRKFHRLASVWGTFSGWWRHIPCRQKKVQKWLKSCLGKLFPDLDCLTPFRMTVGPLLLPV